jgi:hypothetical protein
MNRIRPHRKPRDSTRWKSGRRWGHVLSISEIGRWVALSLAIAFGISAVIRSEPLYGPLIFGLLRLAVAPPPARPAVVAR